MTLVLLTGEDRYIVSYSLSSLSLSAVELACFMVDLFGYLMYVKYIIIAIQVD